MEIITRTQFCVCGELKAVLSLYGVAPFAEPRLPNPPHGVEQDLLAEFAYWLSNESANLKNVLRSQGIEPTPPPNPPSLPSRIEALRQIERSLLKIALDLAFVKSQLPRHRFDRK